MSHVLVNLRPQTRREKGEGRREKGEGRREKEAVVASMVNGKSKTLLPLRCIYVTGHYKHADPIMNGKCNYQKNAIVQEIRRFEEKIGAEFQRWGSGADRGLFSYRDAVIRREMVCKQLVTYPFFSVLSMRLGFHFSCI